MSDSNSQTLGPEVQVVLERVAMLARTAQKACENAHVLAAESPNFDSLHHMDLVHSTATAIGILADQTLIYGADSLVIGLPGVWLGVESGGGS